LIFPGNFPDNQTVNYSDFPETWNDIEEIGVGQGVATYRLNVILDPAKDYAVHTPAVYSAYEFYINGAMVSNNGAVGIDKESSKPFWTQITVPIDHAFLRDTNEFVLHISNFSTHFGGPVDPVFLGDRDYLMNEIAKIRTIDSIISGALLMGGLFFLGLYLFGTSQRIVLYFSLFCVVFSYYNFSSGTYLIQFIYPSFPWFFSVRLEYGSLYLSAFLLATFTQTLYPKDTPRLFTPVMIVIVSVMVGLILFTPVSFFTWLHNYMLMFLLGVMFFGIYIYFRAAFFKRIGSAYSLVGGGFILVILIWKTLDVLIVVSMPYFITPIGYVVFFFLHSLTLSQQFVMSWKIAKEQAENALKIKSNFLSTMSHEIRTPMNAVIGLTNYLLEDDPKDEQMENLRTLKFSASNLLVIINDILDYSKLEADKVELDLQWIHLGELLVQLKNTVQPLIKDKKIKLIMECDQEVPSSIYCDVTRLVQVLTNLLNNAIKFTKEGSVSLTIHLIDKDEKEAQLLIQVMDTGIGIPEEKLTEIFESFTQVSSSTTREYGGTGLGLAISRKLLEIQGVTLQLKSKVGEGSTFYFKQSFLFKEEETPTMIQHINVLDATEGLKGLKILLVEDNEVNVLVARKFLTKWGVKIIHAENGKVGLDLVSENTYDLILMDIQMPVMDGYEATTAIRKLGVKTPIIALTASAFISKITNLDKMGINGYVTKPFDPKELFDTIYRFAKK